MGAGWSDSNNIYIFVNEPIYSPGEQVNGEIFVNVVEDISGGRLMLYLDGEEDVNYTDTQGLRSTYVTEKKLYYTASKNLYTFENGVLPAGKYRFPFCFVLPPAICPNCSVAGLVGKGTKTARYAGYVTYKIRCQVEETVTTPPPELSSVSPPVASAGLSIFTGRMNDAASYLSDDFEVIEVSGDTPEQFDNLMKEAPLNGFLRNKLSKSARTKPVGDLVQEVELSIKVPTEEPNVTQSDIVQHFRTLGCVPSGSLATSVTADRLSCFPGDGVTVNVEIQNRTRKRIKDVEACVVREVIFSVNSREKFTAREVVASEKVPGIPRQKEAKASGRESLHITVTMPPGTQPTMSSTLLRLQYKLEVALKLGEKPFVSSLDLVVLKKSQTQNEYLASLKAPRGWDGVALLPGTDLAMIKVRGAPSPDRGEYTGIGTVIF
ncbi:arrestin (or s-antigen), n-terminal domain-containing protein [Besnoitia besnoiti]|uniref:Arrestin (Or s-antigen), n-terminal domain-containing protein n=1 Tax=Besnoitia besnoiti TaxID=94643 RepID=A0A2A9MN52_BESBE|nr:arrestin (or s-antigen), n-terminal domain-containing protein [Besnoitia besnoiti]PFH37596.1 arrestin (or s-antigen), n-terminal domain-containing protein [Besnoitia besnoiti]